MPIISRDAKKQSSWNDLLEEIHLEEYVPNETEQIFAGKNFVITGSLVHFANRNELKAKIEEKRRKSHRFCHFKNGLSDQQ